MPVFVSGSKGQTMIHMEGSHPGMAITGSEGTIAFTETATGFGNRVGNPNTISSNLAILADYNSLFYGPITVAEGITFTIPADSSVKIVDISDV